MALMLATLAATCSAQPNSSPDRLLAFQQAAAKFKSVISLPQFEVSSNEVVATVRKTIADANAGLDRIAALQPA